MPTPRQIIFDLETGKVLMWGYCVFQYDPLTQGMFENDTFVFREYAEGADPDDPASERIIWYFDIYDMFGFRDDTAASDSVPDDWSGELFTPYPYSFVLSSGSSN
jgi:hypothetical protein